MSKAKGWGVRSVSDRGNDGEDDPRRDLQAFTLRMTSIIE